MQGSPGNRARYNIPNVGIFVWRLQSYPVTVSAAPAAPPGDGRYWFHPLGQHTPLFTQPQTRTELTQVATAVHVSR